LGSSENYIVTKFHGDKLDMEKISGLSLFLYPKLLVIQAFNAEDEVMGVSLYTYYTSDELSGILNADEFVGSPNTLGRLFVHQENFCLVPTELFDPTRQSTYLSFIQELEEGESEAFHQGVHHNSIQVLGTMEKELLGLMDQLLPELEVQHGAVMHLEYILNNVNRDLKESLFASIVPDGVYFAAFREGQPELFNWFKVGNEKEFLKYSLSIIHQLGFSRQKLEMVIIGNLSYVGCTLEGLNPYFKNVTTLSPDSKTNYFPGAERFKNTGLLEAFWSL
jgi:hypothetical protein